jgi:hypothetical protein
MTVRWLQRIRPPSKGHAFVEEGCNLRCRVCGVEKAPEQFTPCRDSRTGRSSRCKSCRNAAVRARRGTAGEALTQGKLSRMPFEARLMARIAFEPNTGCWLWFGPSGSAGYGMIIDKGRRIAAHRASWELHRGPIPPGLFVCHRCDTPLCLNPAHLFLGTNADNMRDCRAKGRTARLCGEDAVASRLTTQQVKDIRARRCSGETTVALGQAFGVTPEQISRICTRKSWAHL